MLPEFSPLSRTARTPALRRAGRADRGIAGVEYGLVICGISILIMAAVSQLGAATSRLMCGVANSLERANDGQSAGGCSFVYVTNDDDSTVSVIDTGSDSVVSTFASGGSNPAAVTVSGGVIYVANAVSGQIAEFSAASLSQLGTITTPVNSHPLALQVAGGVLYTSLNNAASVRAYSLATSATLGAVAVSNPLQIAIVGSTGYVANASAVIPFNLATLAKGATITAGGQPRSVAAGDGLLFSLDFSTANAADVINPASNGVTKAIGVGTGPWAAVVAGGFVYVANMDSNSISVIDDNALTVVRTIHLPAAPIAVAAAAGKIYAVMSSLNGVAVIDTASGAIRKTITVGSNPSAIAVGP